MCLGKENIHRVEKKQTKMKILKKRLEVKENSFCLLEINNIVPNWQAAINQEVM